MDPAAPRPFVTGLLDALENPLSPGMRGVTSLALMWTWEFGNQNGTEHNSWALWPGVTQGAIDSLSWYNGNRSLKASILSEEQVPYFDGKVGMVAHDKKK